MKSTLRCFAFFFVTLMVLAGPRAALAQSPLITGLVTDRQTGQPVPNARVFFYGSAYGTTFTDLSGRYTFSAANLSFFGGAVSGSLYAGALGYFEAPPVSIGDLASEPTLPATRNISLLPGGPVIQGVVRDAATGVGIAGASVNFSHSPMSSFLGGGNGGVITQTDGSYTIDSSFFNESGLASGFSAFLQVNVSGYLGAARSVAVGAYPATQDFGLRVTSGDFITGLVTDRTTGQPIANARVFFYGSAYGTTFTDVTGRYTLAGTNLSLFGGAVSGNLYVGAPGYFEAPPVSIGDLASEPTLPATRNISLLPGGPVIQGVVRDAATGMGIAGASVNFSHSPMSSFLGGGNGGVITQTDGSYTIDSSFFNESGLASGFSAFLQVNVSGYLGAARSVAVGAYPATQDFGLRATSGDFITGLVTDRTTGQPIANARVFFYGSAYGTTFTDVTGRYTLAGTNLSLFGGAVSGNLYVGAPGYFEAPPVSIGDLASEPTLPATRNISLLPGGPVIQGVVRDAATGMGIAGASVNFSHSPMSSFLGGGNGGVITRTDGSYTIDSSFFNESGLASGFSAFVQVNAVRHLGAAQSISLTAYPALLDFTLVSVNQSPVANAGGDRTATVNVPLTLDGTASSDPDGTIVSYTWNFGDGSSSATGAAVSHSYSSAGTFTVVLTVADDDGATASASIQVTVDEPHQITPTITWTAPAPIAFGTPLGAQLNATTTVPGGFSYVPGPGAILNAGHQTLLAIFTPDDPSTYTGATRSVTIDVLKGATTTTLTSSLSPSAFGTRITLTATIAAPGPMGFGVVRFESEIGLIGTIPTFGSNVVVLQTDRLRPGNHTLTARYLGNGNLEASTSASISQTVIGDSRFVAMPATTTPQGPWSIAAGDFNGDGHADAATTNAGADGVSVLLGNGDGTFRPAVNYAAGSVPIALAAADVNHDGHLDLIVSNQNSGNVSVLLGSGDGTFGAPSNFAAGSGSPVVVDVNGDDLLDLVVPRHNCCSAATGVLLGNGDGTFQPVVDYPGGDGSVAVGDFDGDGAPDIAFTMFNGDQIRILKGNGDGTFSAGASYDVSRLPTGIVAKDLNLDGIVDLAFIGYEPAVVGVMLGHGDGTFASPSAYPLLASADSIVAIDANGDGVPDLAVSNRSLGAVVVLIGNGDGSFQPGAAYAGEQGVTGVAAADVNGDGAVDLIASNYDSDSVNAYLNQGGVALSVDVSPSPADAGQAVTITAHVTPTVNLAGTPTGLVVFREGSGILGTLPLAGGQASLVTSTLSPGTHTIDVSYAGDSIFNPKSAEVVEIINLSQTVAVLSPNGGEKVFANVPVSIRWSAGGAPTSFDVTLSRNNGGTFTAVAGCSALPGAVRICTWTPTGPAASNTALIRVTRHDGSGVVSDVSDGPFTIATGAPSVTVTTPNTAVTWPVGVPKTIAWSHNLAASAFVRIELSRDAGASWETIAGSVQNTSATAGSFSWQVTGPPAAALVRVSALDNPATDVSKVAFAIVSPSVTVTAPNTAVTWQSGTAHNVTFSHNVGVGQIMNIDVSRDDGGTWSRITSFTTTAAASGSYSWTVSGPSTQQARVRVGWSGDASVSDASNVNFTITPRIAVSAPNTAVIWGAGSTRTITWNHNLPAGQTVDIVFSGDGGSTWTPIASGVANATATTGSYTGLMPTTPTSQGLVRVRWSSDLTESDVSDVPFTLAAAAMIVTAPNTAVTWTIGTSRNITWTHNLGTAESIRVEVSRDGGASWSVVSDSLPNSANTSGSYSWNVAGPVTTAARLRVTWIRDGAVQDASDVNFTIAPRITVTAPNTAVTWGAGSTRVITWSHNYGVAQTFDIDFSADNGATWSPIAAAVPAATATTGTFTGPMPAVVTAQARIRVGPAGNPGDSDAGNVPFTLAAPTVTVTAPNTNVNWAVGSVHNVTWSHNLGTLESVEIEVSRDGGATWQPVASNTANAANTTGRYAWTVPGPTTAAARIRVTWTRDGAVQDISNVNFRIQ